MRNLEVQDLRILPVCPQRVCRNATHVAYNNNDLFVIKTIGAEAYNINNGEVKPFSLNPPTNCITPISFLPIQNKWWYGTGREFVCICASSFYTFIINTVKEFTVAEWNHTYEVLMVIYRDGEIVRNAVDFNQKCLIPTSRGHLNDGSVNNLLNGSGHQATISHIIIQDMPQTDNLQELNIVEDDRIPRLSWKLEGDMFVVSYFHDGKRCLKTYMDDCLYRHDYEDILGLQPFLAWRPHSTKFLTVVWNENQYCCVLFGRTQWDRQDYDLRSTGKIESIQWSPTGQELAIQQRSTANVASINIYTFIDCDWHLKQSLKFNPENPLIDYKFLTSPHLCILRVISATDILTYYIKSTVYYNRGVAAEERVTAARISGKYLQLSSFSEGLLPSPMFSLLIPCKEPINFVMFHPEKQQLAIVDSSNFLRIYKFTTTSYELIAEYNMCRISGTDIPLRIRNITWVKNTEFVFLKNETTYGYMAQQVYILHTDGCPTQWTVRLCPFSDGNIDYITVARNSEILIVVTTGVIYLYELYQKKFSVCAMLMPIRLDAVMVGSKYYIFGLGVEGFIINNKIIRFISSYTIHDNYLILISNDCSLIVVRLREDSLERLSSSGVSSFYRKPNNLGVKLLFPLPNTCCVVVQHKRGNIEMSRIHMITVDIVESLISDNNWLKALHMLRLERLSCNVVIHLNPHRFLENIPKFLDSVYSLDALLEFLVNLEDGNLFKTILSTYDLKPLDLEFKCTFVVDALVTTMKRRNYLYYIKHIAVAEIMRDPPAISLALTHVAYLVSRSVRDACYADVAEDIINTLSTIKPSLDLYSNALLLYNLDLATFVASRTSVDPTLYRPFISSLRDMNTLEQRFVINKYLGRFTDALIYCVRSQSDNEIYDYILLHDLAVEAYPHIKDHESDLPDKVLRLIGTKLTIAKKHLEAASVYMLRNLKVEALQAYTAGLYWEPVLHLMRELELPQVEKQNVLTTLVDGLLENRKILAAAYVLEHHMNNYERAIQLLIKEELFIEALEMTKKYDRHDIIDSDIEPALKQHLDAWNERVCYLTERFKKYKTRLLTIRSEKLIAYCKRMFPADVESEVDDSQSRLGSIMTTRSENALSFRSTSTTTTRRSRKIDRMIEDTREGAYYEDIALIKVLAVFIEEANVCGPRLRATIITYSAVKNTLLPQFTDLHGSLLQLQNLMQSSISEIWTDQMSNFGGTNLTPEEKHAYANISMLEPRYRAPPKNLDTSWRMLSLVLLSAPRFNMPL